MNNTINEMSSDLEKWFYLQPELGKKWKAAIWREGCTYERFIECNLKEWKIVWKWI